jgi:glycosyltransferase involved in cell wall biosynthesis
VISAVIPCYNNPDIERRAIDAVLSQTGVSEVIVVDDGSVTDETQKYAASRGCRVIAHERNQGTHAAWNSGIAAASNDHIALVGSDVTFFDDQALLDCALALVDYPAAGVVGLAETYLTEAPGRDDARLNSGPGVTSACVILARCLAEVGPFDPSYRRTFGDTDWNERARDADWLLLQFANRWCYHGGSVTRKREGVEADMSLDRRDHERFLLHWAHRPDVLQRHGMAPLDVATAGKTACWKVGEQ